MCCFTITLNSSPLHLGKFDGAIRPEPLSLTNHCIPSTPPPIYPVATDNHSPNTMGQTSNNITADPFLHYIISIGSGGGLGVLLCLTITVCMIGCCLYFKARHLSSQHSNEPYEISHSFRSVSGSAGKLCEPTRHS